jgi:DNA-binding CsgD family transcriptional regulator/TPR repeat protein
LYELLRRHALLVDMTTRAPLVGRTTELSAIRAALVDIDAGHGHVIAITGDAGIGKTRLLTELANLAPQGNRAVLWSHMVEVPGAPPYFLWMPVLRSCFDELDSEAVSTELGDILPDLADILPELRQRFRLQRPIASANIGSEPYRLYDAVSRLLLHLASQLPLVLLLDNLQLADQSSLALLRYFCQQISNFQVLVVVACRDSDLGRKDAARSTIAALSQGQAFTKLALRGIARNEVAELLRQHLGYLPSEGVVDSVRQQSGGNPLFVTEVGAMLARRSPDAPLPGAGFHYRVPESLNEVISARLESLPKATCDLLGIAAVVGREFDVGFLAAITEKSTDRTASLLKPAETEGLITPLGPNRLQFHHVLFREVLYAEHSTVARASWHLRAGEHLERMYRDNKPVRLSQLAHHFFEATPASDLRKTADYCRQAAESAVAGRAYSEATNLYERALQVLEFESHPNSGLRFDLLVAMGRAQYQSGHLNSATQSLLRAALLAHHFQWWRRLGEALIGFQHLCQQSGLRHVVSVPLHKIVLEQLPDDAVELRARAYTSLANAFRMAAEPELAADTFRRGVALARQWGDPAVLLNSLRKGAWVVGRKPEDVEEGLAIAQEALQLAKRLGDKSAVLDALTDLSFQLSHLGRIDELEQGLAELRELATRERLVHFLAIHNGFETAKAIFRGQWPEALQGARSGLNQTPLRGVYGLEGRFAFQMFAIGKAQGSLGDLAGRVQQYVEETPDAELWLPGQVLLHVELDQLSLARAALDRLGDLQHLPRDDLHGIALIYLAEACTKLRDTPRCRVLFDLLLPYRGLNASLGGTVMLGAVSGYLALLAAAIKDTHQARVLYEEAIEMNADMKAFPALARTQADFGRLLLCGDNAEDHARARQLLSRARSLAQAHKLQPVQEAVDSAGERAGADELTDREIQVLKQVAAGCSNREISEKLYISQSTVATHIRHIFRKIGARNRTEAVENARRAALLQD